MAVTSKKGAAARWLLPIAILISSRAARGAPVPQPPRSTPVTAEPSDPKLVEAKNLFHQGNELRKAGDYQRALEYYERSRRLVPSVGNTINAAFCLDQLGRYDEALELYEELLTKLSATLGDDDRQAIGPAMATLRRKVASIDVSANVEGTLLVDGRMRGKLPLLSPVRVLPGKHLVRVIRDGFESFERTIDVAVGETLSIDAKLAPLAKAGRLRVDDPRLAGGDLYVDGVLVGKLPWEGTLGPGRHLYVVYKADLGSPAKIITVLEGQTVLGKLEVGRLGPELSIRVEPASSELWIDDVPVGRGSWRGRLLLGQHTLRASEPGYVMSTQRAQIGPESNRDIVIQLAVDHDHPRWGRKQIALIAVEAFGGPALATSLRSDAESYCDARCSDAGLAAGALIAARAGYEFPFRLSVRASGGYLTITRSFTRTRTRSFDEPPIPVTYTLKDEIRLSGPFGAVGFGYRQVLGESFDLSAGLELGAVFARTRDPWTATAESGGRTVEAVPQPSSPSVSSVAAFAMPSFAAQLKIGAFFAGAGLAALIVVFDGPRYDTQSVQPLGTARGDSFVDSERAYRRTVLWVPHAGAGWRF